MHHSNQPQSAAEALTVNQRHVGLDSTTASVSQTPHFTLVKEALIEIGCVVTTLVDCNTHALWPNGAS